MQFFAWTEHSKPAKRAERQSHVPERQQKLLAEHPIFCFETAIKLLYWCGFVYEHDEVSMANITLYFNCMSGARAVG